MKRIHVAAAVIRSADGHILIAKRPLDKHQGGLWEFPGGKVEAGESVQVALARELFEELGIEVTRAQPLIQVRHDYPDKQVLLDVWQVLGFRGEAHGAEGQPLAWVTAGELDGFEFPAANQPIIRAAQLPDHYLITPEGLDPAQLLRGIERALERGIRLIQLRAPGMAEASYRKLAGETLSLAAGRAKVMLKGPAELLDEFPDAGWHLTARQLRDHAVGARPLPAERLLAASCHDAEELSMAAELRVDFVTLSPVQATASHPEAKPLGWPQVSELLRGFNQPAYLLGGLGENDLGRALNAGGQGVAAVRAFWPALNP